MGGKRRRPAVSAFPVEALRATTGSVSALLFENPMANIPRGLFWSVEVSFAPLVLRAGTRSEEFDCVASCEWLELGIRDWRELAGTEIRGGDELDASFYVTEHDPVIESHIRFGARDGVTFPLRYDMVVDYHGYFGGDEDPRLSLPIELTVPFTGLMVYFDIVKPAPKNASKVARVLEPFVDLAAFGPPELRTNDFGMSAFWLPPTE